MSRFCLRLTLSCPSWATQNSYSFRYLRLDFFCRGSTCGSSGESGADILFDPRFFFLHVCPSDAGHFLNKMPFFRSGGIIADSELSAYVEQQIRIFDILFGRQGKVTSGLFCKGVHFNKRVLHLLHVHPSSVRYLENNRHAPSSASINRLDPPEEALGICLA